MFVFEFLFFVFVFFDVFLLKIVVGEFYIFDDFVEVSMTFLSGGGEGVCFWVVSHLFLHEFVLEVADVFLVILNYEADVFLEDAW